MTFAAENSRNSPDMPLDWSPLVAFLRTHSRPLLMTHIRPDGDGLGAQLALADALRAIGLQPRVFIASKLPPRYAFLDPKREVIEDFRTPISSLADRDSIVVLDTGTWNQLGEFADYLKASPLPRVVVDHHRTQDDLGGQRFVDIGAEATGRLAFEIIEALGAPLSPAAANNLFLAIAHDTGWFRHPNTTPETFALAEKLLAAGANPTALYERMFETSSLARFHLIGKALERLQTRANGKIAFTEVYLADYAATGAVPGDTEDLIDFPRSVEGVEVALLFIEQPEGGTKVSFRARVTDVSKLAESLGGGGHKLAAGARVNDTLANVRNRVLAATEQAL